MKITERKLRSIIRSVIKESMDYKPELRMSRPTMNPNRSKSEDLQDYLDDIYGDYPDDLMFKIQTNHNIENILTKADNNEIDLSRAKGELEAEAERIINNYYSNDPSKYHPYDRD